MKTLELPQDGERYLPEYTGVIRLEHMHRYLAARALVEGCDVLDIASGEGYGSNILRQAAQSVIGVDNNALAVEVATQRYARDGLEFRHGDARKIPLEDASVDAVISFETIEHLEEHDEMMAELRRVLRPGGFILISSPNRAIYSDATGYKNEFHVHELYTEEFQALVGRHFKHQRLYKQKTAGASVIATTDGESAFRKLSDTGTEIDLSGHRYDLVLASDGNLPPLPHSLYELPDGSFAPETFEFREREFQKVAGAKDHFEKLYHEHIKELKAAKDDRTGLETRIREAEDAYRELQILQNEARALHEEIANDLEATVSAKVAAELHARALEFEVQEAKAALEEAIATKPDVARLSQVVVELTEGSNALIVDANRILNDKWWRRTALFRRLSNSLRKRRGRPKKKYPKKFELQEYIKSTARTPDPIGEPVTPSPLPKKVATPQRRPCIVARSKLQRPHLTVVAMGRNEAARVDDTMRHFCALFDRVIVIDHLSQDDTAARAARYDGHADTEVQLFRGNDNGYPQSEYMTAVANSLIDEGRSDWVFFLDFDEFLTLPDRGELEQSLVALQDADVIHGHWYNLHLDNHDAESLQGASARIPAEVSRFVKIALNLNQIDRRYLRVEQGNHAVTFTGSAEPTIGERGFGIFHLPILNEAVFRVKIEQGAKAYEAMSVNAELGSHWREIRDNSDKVMGDPDLMRELALRYGTPLDKIISDFADGQGETPSRPITLNFAQAEPLVGGVSIQEEQSAEDIPCFTLDTVVDIVSKSLGSDDPDPPNSTPEEMLGTEQYRALPDREAPDEPMGADGLDERFAQLATRAVMDIEVIAPSAWYAHIPFLFALMDATRPRRYVELGTHAGCSFFAACQHIKSNGHYGEAVAIDLWEGDHQAGFYDQGVFERFKFLLNRHFPQDGRFIRSYFSDAVGAFEDGSIDLLHIDGLHTYEAVREDYETWRSKLTPNGTILFHDTSEYQSDFGVWQFFEEIRSEASASFRFFHCHGLGVLAFGSREKNPAIDIIDTLAATPVVSENFFRTVGEALFQGKRMRLHDARTRT